MPAYDPWCRLRNDPDVVVWFEDDGVVYYDDGIVEECDEESDDVSDDDGEITIIEVTCPPGTGVYSGGAHQKKLLSISLD